MGSKKLSDLRTSKLSVRNGTPNDLKVTSHKTASSSSYKAPIVESPACCFLDRLPGELRNKVYEPVASNHRRSALHKYESREYPLQGSIEITDIPLDFLVSCKQIRAECLPLSFPRNKHWFAVIRNQDYDHVVNWLRAVGPENMSQISSLKLLFNGTYLMYERGRFRPNFDHWHCLISELARSGIKLSQIRTLNGAESREENFNATVALNAYDMWPFDWTTATGNISYEEWGELEANGGLFNHAAFEGYLFNTFVLRPLFRAYAGDAPSGESVQDFAAYETAHARLNWLGDRDGALPVRGQPYDATRVIAVADRKRHLREAPMWFSQWLANLSAQRARLAASSAIDKSKILAAWDARYGRVLRRKMVEEKLVGGKERTSATTHGNRRGASGRFDIGVLGECEAPRVEVEAVE